MSYVMHALCICQQPLNSDLFMDWYPLGEANELSYSGGWGGISQMGDKALRWVESKV